MSDNKRQCRWAGCSAAFADRSTCQWADDGVHDWPPEPPPPPPDLLALLRTVTVAADRLMQKWSEVDDGCKRDLWRQLGRAVTEAEPVVYPLPTGSGDK